MSLTSIDLEITLSRLQLCLWRSNKEIKFFRNAGLLIVISNKITLTNIISNTVT